jgi:Core-2/I-Branching enzyme
VTRIAYVVSAYRLPQQLERLLRRLAAPDASFAVHVDRKTRRRVYEEMVSRTRDLDVVFLPRHVSHWGGFGHVRATLKGIDHFVGEDRAFDYAVLLTGQDYPLRSPSGIADFLGSAGRRSFMSYLHLPFPPWGKRGGLERIENWHFIKYRPRLHLALPLHRRLPLGLRPWGGSAYWCLERTIVDYVHDFVRAHPDYVAFFEHVYVPDELFFQTIVLNSALRNSVENDDLRYLDWTRRPAPAILDRRDLAALVSSEKLFARKFDVRVDADILDQLDAHINAPRAAS